MNLIKGKVPLLIVTNILGYFQELEQLVRQCLICCFNSEQSGTLSVSGNLVCLIFATREQCVHVNVKKILLCSVS